MIKLDLSGLNKNESLAVAVSGGKDSMALLSLLVPIVKVKVVNVEHGIRGEASLNDSYFVKKQCDKLGVELKEYKVDAPSFCRENNLSLEEGARILRYRCFDDAIRCGFADKIATAHHLSDCTETMLFNLFRGTGLKGMSGISDRDYLIRPLKGVSKEQIDEYVEVNKIPFVTDETNFDDNYLRNFIRNDLVPRIKEKFPQLDKSLERFSDTCKKTDEYLQNKSLEYIDINGKEASVSLLAQGIVADYACINALKQMGIKKDYEKKHVEAILKLKSAKNGTCVDLPYNIKAVRDYDKITLYKKEECVSFNVPFKVGKSVVGNREIEVCKGKGKLTFDLKKIPQGAVLRTREEKDRFKPFGGGSKKLKKYLIDKKIPARQRDNLILLANGNNVLLIVGLEISDDVKVDANSTEIYTIGEKNV